MATTRTSRSVTSVTVHPLVLLSVVDHYNRVARDTQKRVIGVLLGETSKGVVDVTNSYAVPFEEDPKKPGIFFVDHIYHEHMFTMFKKVNAKERVVGWYSTGPKIRPNDLEINDLWKRYSSNPVLVIVDVKLQELGIPTKAYVVDEEISTDGTPCKMEFVHIPSDIGAVEAEEVGVEHLLRDIQDTSISTVANNVNAKLLSLKSLVARLKDMQDYLSQVCEGALPINQTIISQMQDIFNLLPNLNVEEMVRSFAVKTNDMMLVIYLSSMIRSIIALHNLINNKLTLRANEHAKKEGVQKGANDKEKTEDEKKTGENSSVDSKGKNSKS
eukprot:TRINITY_DN2553_c0_g1_i2.p1 TRINITY_DN2553_c0_g1~~TRINITY_DN2553_c0_g1_i2.p1  ORF type:complete len:359 (+),score=67.93 TRINITY_DN2553_c0_g1_i2:95-1078(+)